MTERRYTLAEIDAMRKAMHANLEADLWRHTTILHGDWETPLKEDVERQLRTAMIAGVDPAEFTNRTGNPADDKTEN